MNKILKYIKSLIDSSSNDNAKLFAALLIVLPVIIILALLSPFFPVPEFIFITLVSLDIALFGLGTYFKKKDV